MEITLAGGALVDVASKDDLAEHHRRIEKLVGDKPDGSYYAINASGTTLSGFTGSGPTAFAFTPSSPPPGRMWELQWVAIFVTSPVAAAIANLTAAVMVGRSPIGPGGQMQNSYSINFPDVRVPALAVPVSVTVPDKVYIKSQEQLYILLGGSGLAALTVYNATAGVIDTVDTGPALFY